MCKLCAAYTYTAVNAHSDSLHNGVDVWLRQFMTSDHNTADVESALVSRQMDRQNYHTEDYSQ